MTCQCNKYSFKFLPIKKQLLFKSFKCWEVPGSRMVSVRAKWPQCPWSRLSWKPLLHSLSLSPCVSCLPFHHELSNEGQKTPKDNLKKRMSLWVCVRNYSLKITHLWKVCIISNYWQFVWRRWDFYFSIITN